MTNPASPHPRPFITPYAQHHELKMTRETKVALAIADKHLPTATNERRIALAIDIMTAIIENAGHALRDAILEAQATKAPEAR